jgi:putative DNA primase/helicase
MTQVVEKDFFKEKFNPETVDIFKTESEEPYLTIEGVTYRIQSAEFNDLLWKQYYLEYRNPPSCCKLKQAIKDLYMFGKSFAPVKKIHRRFAKADDSVFIDLGTPDFSAVKITRGSVSVVQNPEAKFIRPKVQRQIGTPMLESLPEYLNLLKRYIPFKTEDDFVLFVSWLLGCMNCDGGYPVLFLVGEQGSAKSTTCRLIKDLLDASSVSLRNMPKSEKELMISAINDFVLCFDNTSKISDSQSDNLCKLATGSAFTTRRLYSTAGEVQLVSKNPCVINGIACLPTRQDLLDRSIIVSFDFISPEVRKTEKELMEAWEYDRPLIFGALCQAAAVALKNYEQVSEHGLPRMADFAKWVIAGEERLPWEKGQFMETMGNLRAKIVEEALDADPVSMAVLKLMKDRESWSGSPTDLLEVLSACIDQDNKKYPGFPKIANQLSRDLERMSSFLRDRGIIIEKKHSGTRSITLINTALQYENQFSEEAKTDAMKKTMGEVRKALPPAPQSEEAIEPHEELMATASDDVDF